MKTKLNKIELYIYFAFWIISFIYTWFKLYESQTELLKDEVVKQDLPDLQPGWSFFSRLQDTSDVEWNTWKYFIRISWPYLLIQCFVTEIIRKTKIIHLKYWFITSGVIFITYNFGYKQLLLILVQPILYASIIFLGGKKLSIWICSVFLLLSYNSIKYKMFFWQFLERDDLHDEEVYLILFCIPWGELRCISYCFEYLEKAKENQYSSKLECFSDLLSYFLYVPLMYTGPVILYEDFKKNYDGPCESIIHRLKYFIWNIGLYLLYTFILEILLHYIYFYAMQANMTLIRMLPTLALCGGGLWMGTHFHVKYVVAYGMVGAFAKLDSVYAPPTPRCIARIHIYSHMWRYFDVGLYKFLLKYVYLPTLDVESKYLQVPKILSKMFASLVTFIFIFMWHGTIKRIFLWCVFNYLGITVEYIAKEISQSDRYKWFKEKVLKTDTMETRFIGLLCVPLLTLSAISNFYLLGGTEIGNLFFECFLHPHFLNLNSMLVALGLYCCCMVSMALQDVPSRTAVKCPVKELQ